jgi:hypothetical protein
MNTAGSNQVIDHNMPPAFCMQSARTRILQMLSSLLYMFINVRVARRSALGG